MTKVAFFGTSDRSVPILEALKQRFDLVLCVTKEDVLVGRHQTPKETQVKKWAKENKVNFVTVNAETKEIIRQIKLSNAEIGIVADFGIIIHRSILEALPKGLINIHFSLLPKYRGASPVQFAILNGDAQTGITYQIMEETLDTGPILYQVPHPLTGKETSGELYEKLFKLSAEHLPQVLKSYLEGKIVPQVQEHTKASYTRRIQKEDARINWLEPAPSIERAVRAYNPWPIAWTTLKELPKSIKIKDPRNMPKTAKIYEASLTPNGELSISKIQMESGKILTWKQFENGYLTT